MGLLGPFLIQLLFDVLFHRADPLLLFGALALSVV